LSLDKNLPHLTLPNKGNIPCPNPAVGYLDLAQPGASLPKPLPRH